MAETRKELNLEEMDKVEGGVGGSRTLLPPKADHLVYRIARHDSLHDLAERFGTTVEDIMSANTTLTDEHDLTTNYFIYIPQPSEIFRA